MHRRKMANAVQTFLGLIIFLGGVSTVHVKQGVGGEEAGARSTPQLQPQDRQQAKLLPHTLPLPDFLLSWPLGMSLTTAEWDMEWSRTYRAPDFEFVRGIVQTADGGFALAGYAENRFGRRDDWLLKTDARGNMEWQQTFGGTSANHPCSVIQTTDSGFVLAGETHILETAHTDA